MTISPRSRTLFVAVLWIAGGAGIGTATADDVQVNTYTTGIQVGASVSSDADGDFVVVWTSDGSVGTDSDPYSIQGRRYASDGTGVGGQFQVNTYTSSYQYGASVSVDADGDFVVVWSSLGSSGTDSSETSIQGQRYASDGSIVGGQFQVNTYTSNRQYHPSVSVDADGDFVVVWHSFAAAADPSLYSVHGQRYASDGSTVGSQFQVNTYTTNDQYGPSVAMDADGDFVVVWRSDGSAGTDASGRSVQGRRYASDGSRVSDEFQVNTYTTNDQRFPAVSVDADGDFVVVWRSDGSGGTDSSLNSIQGQRFAANGSSVGSQFQVNSYTTNDQYGPSVSMDADGDFVVGWSSSDSGGTDSDNASVHGQRYASDGSSVGAEFQVNTYTNNGQRSPSVSVDADGDLVVVWQSFGSTGTDQSSFSVQRTEGVLFVDGFESGDTTAWTSTSP